MVDERERRQCLNNLALMVLADGEISSREIDFLQKAAALLQIEMADGSALLQKVQDEETPIYTVQDPVFARKVLKAMVEMASRDGHMDDEELNLLRLFVKACDLPGQVLEELVPTPAKESLQRATSTKKRALVVTTDYEKIDAFLRTLTDCGIAADTAEYRDVLHGDALGDHTIVCLHGAAQRETTVKRCDNLLHKAPGLTIVPILGRYQGNQVKYLHELGIRRCIVEPVFPVDIAHILAEAGEKLKAQS